MPTFNEETYELIDSYLLGKLKGEELADFEIKMALDEDLQKEVEFQKLVIGSIQNQRKEELKKYIRQNAKVDKSGINKEKRKKPAPAFWQKKWPKVGAGILVATGIAVLLFQNLQQEKENREIARIEYKMEPSGQALMENAETEYFTQNDTQLALNDDVNAQTSAPEFKEEADHTKTFPPADSMRDVPVLAENANEETELTLKKMPPISMDERQAAPMAVPQKDARFLKSQDSVRQDILLKDTILLAYTLVNNPKPESVEDYQLTQKNSKLTKREQRRQKRNAETKSKLKNDTAEMAKPSRKTEDKLLIPAKKPAENIPLTTAAKPIKIEFWQSPINFKGYKYFRNKLYLYGLKPDTEISLFLYNDKLYLQTPKGIFNILEQNSYNPFIQVKNPEILEQFKD